MSWTDYLVSKNVFLAHCWSTCTGSSRYKDLSIEERIKNVLNHLPTELPCSTIQQNDTIHFDYLKGPVNFFGPIGVIIAPGIITSANAEDAGFPAMDDSSEQPSQTDIDVDSLEKAITNRSPNKYNEIRVQNYDCIGVFYCMDDVSFISQVISAPRLFSTIKPFSIKCFKLCLGNLYNVSVDVKTDRIDISNTPTSIHTLYNCN